MEALDEFFVRTNLTVDEALTLNPMLVVEAAWLKGLLVGGNRLAKFAQEAAEETGAEFDESIISAKDMKQFVDELNASYQAGLISEEEMH